jgi:multidrug efflux pump subunit AcrA (membrane-fusion protein)
VITDHPTQKVEKVEKVEKMEKAEKVRGMNASLSTSSDGALGPLSERDPGRIHITRRQIVFGLVLVLLAAVATVLTVQSVTAGEASFPAVVSTSKTYDLNFADSAKVTSIKVKVGQTVAAGQVLATQDASSLVAQLFDEEAVVQADKEALAQAGAPSLTPGQQEQDSLQAAQAQTALTNAQANLNATKGTAAANVAAAQTALSTAESQATTDSSLYAQACPNGVRALPDVAADGLAGPIGRRANAVTARCRRSAVATIARCRTGDREQRPVRPQPGELPVVPPDLAG